MVFFRWTNKTGSKWFKILRNWEFFETVRWVEHFLMIFSIRDRIYIVGPKYFIWNCSPKGCFSFTTHSLYSLDIRGGVELGLSFPLQWHNSYRQLVKSFWQTRTNYRFGKLRRVILQHRGIAHHSLCGSSLVNVIWLRTPTDGREQEKSMIFQFSPGTRLGWNGL